LLNFVDLSDRHTLQQFKQSILWELFNQAKLFSFMQKLPEWVKLQFKYHVPAEHQKSLPLQEQMRNVLSASH
jgi:hypothetical protein